MKKLIISIVFALVCPAMLQAQSSMTDDQVISFVLKEQKAGTSQSQIVTKLIQSGVDISQIRSVKNRYDRQINNKGLGTVADNAVTTVEDRMRKANGAKVKNTDRLSSNQIRSIERTTPLSNEEQTAAQLQMMTELNTFMPDSSLNAYRKAELAQNKRNQVFGRDIFSQQSLTFEPNMNIATPQNYQLGPGDEVFIDIYGASQKTINATISPDGEVTIPEFGPIQVSGLTVAQANQRLRSTLGTRYSSSSIKLTVGQTKTISVNIMGEVKRPGTYTLSAFSSVFRALYMAGGPSDIGTLRNIKVFRRNRLIATVDVYDYILNGKASNIHLANEDVIAVGPYDCLVNLVGKVKRPMFYEMKKNESVGSLLKYSGGFASDAYTKSVRIVRKTGREYSVFNVGEFDMSSFRIADGDSVSVDSILPRFANTVELKGATFRPGLYQIGGDINSVRTLLKHAEGPTEQAFTAHAVMHRMKPDRTLEVIPVDIDGIMSGQVADIPLKENDVLFIPTKSEMMQQQTITIHGEVQYPGIYHYADNQTIEDFILQAGGLKDAASTVKVDVARRILNPKAITTDSLIAHTYSFALKDGFVIDGEPGFKLMPFDEVYVRRSPGFSTQKNVSVEGQIMFGGTYTLTSKNERLTSIINKAGGLTDKAYINGARLERRITPDERLRMQTVMKMLQSQNGEKDTLDVNKLNLGETYYVGIELDKALKNPGGDNDIVLREGDRIIIPEYNGTVKISGAVMYPTTVAYEKGKRASWYIDNAGGWDNQAKKSRTYIIYMNGMVARVGHNANVRPGCEIVVPNKPKRDKGTISQWLGIGTSIASIATMLATIANLVK